MKKIIIFTDLDGTLLDHYTYSFDAAREALSLVKKNDIPLILTSSKTFFEMKKIQKALSISQPFIFENGCGVAWGKGHFPTKSTGREVENWEVELLGPDYDKIVQILSEIRGKYGFNFRGFSDLSTREISGLTGLPLPEVKLAKKRLCSEPLLWLDSSERLGQFEQALKEYGLKILQGGRFRHVLGDADKGKAAHLLINLFAETHPDWEIETVGVGDSPNDLALLLAVDIPVVVRRPDRSQLHLQNVENAIYAEGIGPRGWNEAIMMLLRRKLLQ